MNDETLAYIGSNLGLKDIILTSVSAPLLFSFAYPLPEVAIIFMVTSLNCSLLSGECQLIFYSKE